MTFPERYKQEETWHGKVMIMEIYHLAMTYRYGKDWTISHTSLEFNVSVGLVSENLKLAKALHEDETIIKCESRQDALKKLNGR
jgi:hypothetical protein